MTKFINKYVFLFCIVLGTCVLSSCSKDDGGIADGSGEAVNPDKNLPDPTGTVTLNMMVGDDKWVTISNFGEIRINSAYNFEGESYRFSFVSLGKMKGLGNVTTIPQDGWNRTVAVNPGEGYVVRYYSEWESERCARLYVVSEISGTSGGVIGYTVKCQAPFELAPKFKESSIEFDATENLSKKLTAVNMTYAEVVSCPDWCKVTRTEKGFMVTATPNYTGTEYSGTIEFKNSIGTTSVTVKQKKSDNPKFAAGRGTEKTPWTIATGAQLDEVRNFPDAYYELSSDIDLSSYLGSKTTGWKPIEGFTGKFDGKKHTIKGLWIKLSSINNVGLFAEINNGSVSNLFVELDKKGITGANGVGGICGTLNGSGTIECCMVTGDIDGNSSVGGICGYTNSNSFISQCASSGNITAIDYAGGISGYNIYYAGRVENCYSTANVKGGNSYSTYACGIGGASLKKCYFAGTLSAPDASHMYPIAVESYSGCYYDSDKVNNVNNNVGGLTTAEMKKQSSFQNWDFNEIWSIKEGVDYPKLRCLQK